MTQIAPRRRESLTDAARRLLTEKPDGTYDVRIPYENRTVTVTSGSNAWIIAKAAAAKMRIAAE
ncbi:hypothetical protein GCM10011374_22590 [Kocuria dechangensis]|jgi:hypothetical protein|uniref:Uncharacterized protein n=1 Tax=Kocuria dechangensis TaxID=1176249 RepID=A0A917LVA2_9MICC|nr:hypothetical protein [Kocuria dechangensis]GGG59177.1 hypothetical protein GCM10011374_22590 [Kocuria dechangensis]